MTDEFEPSGQTISWAGLKLTVIPDCGWGGVGRSTGPAKPLRLVTITIAVAEEPAGIARETVETEMVKSATWTVMSAQWTREPLDSVSLIEYLPGAEELNLHRTVEEDEDIATLVGHETARPV